MRITFFNVALGLSLTAAVVATIVPPKNLNNAWYVRSAYGVEKIVNNIGNTLSTAANAQEADTPAIDFDKLIKVDGEKYEITVDDSISLDVLTSHKIRKIGYGKETMVNVVRTTSGTYSSDALTSPNILYPGIEVNRVLPKFAKNMSIFPSFLWLSLSSVGSGETVSFGHVNGGGSYVSGSRGTCIRGAGYRTCS